MMLITGDKPRTKSEMLSGLKPGYIKTKLVGRNTIKAEYPDNTIIIRYWDTDVVTINPDKSIILNSGGFMTKTTKERIEEFTRIGISQRNSIWYIVRNIHNGYPSTNEGLPLFYDGIHISESGEILSGIRFSPDETIKQFKKDLKKLTNKITKESLESYFTSDAMAGDCLICRVDRVSKKATSDHLISHVLEGYMHGSLMILCMELSGRCNPQLDIQLKMIDNIRKCVTRVISDTCIPVLINNPEMYNNMRSDLNGL